MFKHCKKQNLGYFSHMRQALSYYVRIQKAALCVLMHAIYPDVFEETASTEIKKMAIHFLVKNEKKEL